MRGMKFIVDNAHREFFQENGWIEFEGVVGLDACTAILSSIQQVFRRRGAPRKASLPGDTDTLFKAGRDVWRDDPELKRVICHRTLSEIVSELVEIKPLRLAYDQLLSPSVQGCLSPGLLMGSLGPCQGSVATIAICLEGQGEGLLPSQPGNITAIVRLHHLQPLSHTGLFCSLAIAEP